MNQKGDQTKDTTLNKNLDQETFLTDNPQLLQSDKNIENEKYEIQADCINKDLIITIIQLEDNSTYVGKFIGSEIQRNNFQDNQHLQESIYEYERNNKIDLQNLIFSHSYENIFAGRKKIFEFKIELQKKQLNDVDLQLQNAHIQYKNIIQLVEYIQEQALKILQETQGETTLKILDRVELLKKQVEQMQDNAEIQDDNQDNQEDQENQENLNTENDNNQSQKQMMYENVVNIFELATFQQSELEEFTKQVSSVNLNDILNGLKELKSEYLQAINIQKQIEQQNISNIQLAFEQEKEQQQKVEEMKMNQKEFEQQKYESEKQYVADMKEHFETEQLLYNEGLLYKLNVGSGICNQDKTKTLKVFQLSKGQYDITANIKVKSEQNKNLHWVCITLNKDQHQRLVFPSSGFQAYNPIGGKFSSYQFRKVVEIVQSKSMIYLQVWSGEKQPWIFKDFILTALKVQ